MDYLSDKLNSITGEALSGINEMKRKRKQKQEEQNKFESDENQESLPNSSGNPQGTSATINITQSIELSNINSSNTLQAGFPFGGDTFTPSNRAIPPPIGFRTDILNVNAPNKADHQSTNSPPGLPSQPNIDRHLGDSETSLYEGDAWTRVWFQRVMILTLLRLLLFIRKVYEDFQATKTYNLTGNTGHFLISAATLFLPTIVFTTYRVARYLQVVLPSLRETSKAGYPLSIEARKATNNELIEQDKDSNQVTEALMGSESIRRQQQNDDDGLVTARQTPTNLEEYHDSSSQQGPVTSKTTSPELSTTMVKNSPGQSVRDEHKETVNVDKLVGNVPDKDSLRVTIGASEQILHGLLFVFWQLKRQVDVMGYLVERSCLWRRPKEQEKEELGRLRTGSDGLEWFQDFYAAFLAILAQVYTLGAHWSSREIPQTSTLHLSTAGLNKAISSESSEISVSQTAKILGNAINQQVSGNGIDGKDILIMSQLLVSSAVVFSLLVAVRRRDDGPLTFVLSMIGWGSIFASRIIIIALAFVHIGWKIMLTMVAIHVLGITCWIYKIAIDSHNGKKDESEESRWDNDVLQEQNAGQSTELGVVSNSTQTNGIESESDSYSTTSQWSALEHVILLSQILILFALPSLFYWPIMFNLKLHCRPFKYLVLILAENFVLMPAIWLTLSSTATLGQWYLLGAVGGFSIVGFIFVSLYVSCKPSLTEYFARADEQFNEAEKSGIYFEFCSRVFKMPDLGKQSFKRLMNQSEQVETFD